MLKYAIHYGAILGLFWMFKYLFLIGSGFSDHVFIYVYYVLNVGTFLLLYIFTFKFKTDDPQNTKGIFSCILFVMLVCFFASFFEAAIVYAHYQFINPAYFSKLITPAMDMIEHMPYSAQEKEIVTSILSGKLVYILAGVIGNIILGFIMGLMMGYMVNTNIDRNQS